MKTLAVSLLLLIICGRTFAQEIKIAPVLGPSVTIPLLSKDLKEAFSEESLAETGNSVKAKFPPVAGLQAGALVDYQFNEVLSLQSGLIFNFRGFTGKLTGTFEDDNGDFQKFKYKAKQSFTYLEVPIWLSYSIGENGFKIIGGPGFGFAIGGKATVSAKGGDISESDSGKLTIGTDPTDDLKPFDLNLNIGLAKVITLGDRPLEISVFAQPSITKWMPMAPEDSEYFARHFTAGFRVAYFFSIK